MDEKALHDDANPDAYAHLWDDPTIMDTTLEAAIAAVWDAHAGTGRCCTLCPVCRRYNAMITSLLTANARKLQDLDQQNEKIAQRQQESDQRLQEIAQQQQESVQQCQDLGQRWQDRDQTITELLVVHEQYAALRDAHEALMLEHADLEAAYFVARQALRRQAKKDSE